MIRPRVIPTLLIDDGNLVKTKGFKSPVYLGDPLNAIRIFNEKGVDELAVLDIGASVNNKDPDYGLLEKMASEAFMPLSVGGGIRTIDQMKRLFRLGFEKVIINTSFVDNVQLVKDAAGYFGSQSIVCSIDYRKSLLRDYCYTHSGKQKTKHKPLELAQMAENMGAGELLLYCIDRDGKRMGYDLGTISEVSKTIKIPVIACGGANDIQDLKRALSAGASAVAAGSLFVFFGKRQAILINYPSERELIETGIYAL